MVLYSVVYQIVWCSVVCVRWGRLTKRVLTFSLHFLLIQHTRMGAQSCIHFITNIGYVIM